MKILNIVKILLLIKLFLATSNSMAFEREKFPMGCGTYQIQGTLTKGDTSFRLQINPGSPSMLEFNLYGGSLRELMLKHRMMVAVKVKVEDEIKKPNYYANIRFIEFLDEYGYEAIQLLESSPCMKY